MYTKQSHSPTMPPVGARVFWCDPDGGTNSGPGTVLRVQHGGDDAVISIAMDDGGETEAYIHELDTTKKRRPVVYVASAMHARIFRSEAFAMGWAMARGIDRNASVSSITQWTDGRGKPIPPKTEHRIKMRSGLFVASDEYVEQERQRTRCHRRMGRKLAATFGEHMTGVSEVNRLDEGFEVIATIFVPFEEV